MNNAKHPSPSTILTPKIPAPVNLDPDSRTEVKTDIADTVKQRVEEMVPTLTPDVPYTLRKICGEEFWATIPERSRSRMGVYVAYLVATKQLPLLLVGCEHASPKRYKLQ